MSQISSVQNEETGSTPSSTMNPVEAFQEAVGKLNEEINDLTEEQFVSQFLYLLIIAH
jgi:hypothetical protein